MTETPLVSILMNCFNGEEYLQEAIDSIISQTYENWELIFWDNQSIDKSAEIFLNLFGKIADSIMALISFLIKTAGGKSPASSNFSIDCA